MCACCKKRLVNRYMHWFTGKEREDDLGLMHYGARLYLPEIGRSLQVDPAREFNNPYSYVGNSPVMAVDPTGKMDRGLLPGEVPSDHHTEDGPDAVVRDFIFGPFAASEAFIEEPITTCLLGNFDVSQRNVVTHQTGALAESVFRNFRIADRDNNVLYKPDERGGKEPIRVRTFLQDSGVLFTDYSERFFRTGGRVAASTINSTWSTPEVAAVISSTAFVGDAYKFVESLNKKDIYFDVDRSKGILYVNAWGEEISESGTLGLIERFVVAFMTGKQDQ